MIKLSFKKKAQSDRNSWVLTHARGNLSARDAVEDEESPNSCEDDTSSESSDSDDSSNDFSTCVEESFEVMFVLEEEIQQVNQVWGINGRRLFTTGGGGRWLALILSLCEWGLKLIFAFWEGRGGMSQVWGIFHPFPSPPSPHQVIIAQSPNVWWKNT